MQRNTFVMAGLLFAALGVTSMAHAACSCATGGTRLDENGINTKLAGKVVCALFGSGPSTERWQELHNGDGIAGGTISELGNVAGGETVGSWKIVGTGENAVITYSYIGGTSYSYEVCEEGTNVHFCGIRAITNATVGSAKCW
jgi:hypothetical protein